ncbi:hypothetical protein PHMEG_0009052 [Phytophthora megakarya]|uniref:Ty3 transposon capsid-like protein domain-containing protein n=1 Tax=Phytophthora megakarya TaxID=4795 RepID=A0A225WII4_9STRA|nr:hypothetical protein PHMEG_0009052 [Phytophthora megakarya]
MDQLLAQTAQLQQQFLQAQSRPRPTRKKSDPPRFEGNDNDDLELWNFNTEQYYSDFYTGMQELSSSFSEMVFANLGVDVQAWFRDLKLSMGSNPLTWALFKERIRARFRHKYFKYKTLSKMFELKPTKPQQEYTSRFLHLLSQVDTELPDVVKRWFSQQNLLSDTSAYISRNVPETLEQAIEMDQRYEDAKPAHTLPLPKKQGKPTARPNSSTNAKTNKDFKKTDSQVVCGYCSKKNHVEEECRKRPVISRQVDLGRQKRSGSSSARQKETLAFHKDKLYCYLTHEARIKDRSVRCFVDSGSSFDAISPYLAQNLNLDVTLCSKSLAVKICNNRRAKIPRRETTITLDMDCFPANQTHVYVMPVPEGKDVLFSWSWLEGMNPDIN